MMRLVIKLNTVPVRSLRLRNLVNETAKKRDLNIRVSLIEELEGEPAGLLVFTRADDLSKLWEALVDALERLMKVYGALASKALRRNVSEVRVVGVLADIVSYSLRWPLYLHPSPELAIYSPHIAFPLYRVLGLFCEKLPRFYVAYKVASQLAGVQDEVFLEDVQRDLEKAGCRIDLDSVRLLASLYDLFVNELPQLLELALYSVPADTRLGLNSSPLLLHDILSSAIATTILASTGIPPGDEKLEVARLAALLHDIGKPLNWEAHEQESTNVTERLLKALLEELDYGKTNVENLARKIVEVVRNHHNHWECAKTLGKGWDRVCRAVAEGDKLASALDRVADLILGCIEGKGLRICEKLDIESLKKLGKILAANLDVNDPIKALHIAYRYPREKRKQVWNAWWNLYLRAFADKNLRNTLVKALESLAAMLNTSQRLIIQEAPLSEDWRICTLVIDIGGVQKLIRESSKLRNLAGMSVTIDFVTMVGVPLALYSFGVPLESIIFAGGATLHVIAPCNIIDRTKKDLHKNLANILGEDIAKLAFPEGIQIRIGSGNLSLLSLGDSQVPLYGYTINKTYRRLSVERMAPRVFDAEKPSLAKISGKPCPICQQRPGIILVKGEPDRLCPTCAARYEVFGDMGLKYDRRRALQVLSTLPQGCSDVIEELIAVAEPVEALTGPRGSKLAALKTDGNVMGSFIASSLTPAIYFEKSVRIDLAIKRSIEEIYRVAKEVLRDSCERKAVDTSKYILKYVLGIVGYSFMYAGGDDALMFVPHEVALPSALLLAYTFTAETGFRATLSVGVAAGPPEQPIWWLLDSAEELLETAKKVTRKESIKVIDSWPQRMNESGGAILYDYMANGALTPIRVGRRLKTRRLHGKVSLLFGDTSIFKLTSLINPPTGGKLEPLRPQTIKSDEALNSYLRDLLEKTMNGEIRGSEKLKVVDRIAAIVKPGILAVALIASSKEAENRQDKELMEGLSRLIQSLGMVSDPRHVESVLTEIYLVSRLTGG